jgi:hypothetical protein
MDARSAIAGLEQNATGSTVMPPVRQVADPPAAATAIGPGAGINDCPLRPHKGGL